MPGFRRRHGTLLSATMVALLAASAVMAAEQPGSPKLALPDPAPRLLPLKGATGSPSCAALGPGFIKVDGTNTCVKIGGAVRVDAHGSR